MKMRLSPPWVTYYSEIKALFAKDPEIKVVFDQEDYVISVYVKNAAKAEALEHILPVEKAFGNVSVKIAVIPANDARRGDKYEGLYETAFDGNPVLAYVQRVDCPLGSFTYIVWGCDIIQFFDDNLGDVAGNQSMLCADAAKDVFDPVVGVCHCTEPFAKIDECEWP